MFDSFLAFIIVLLKFSVQSMLHIHIMSKIARVVCLFLYLRFIYWDFNTIGPSGSSDVRTSAVYSILLYRTVLHKLLHAEDPKIDTYHPVDP